MSGTLIVRRDERRAAAWPSFTFAVRRPLGRALRVDQPVECPLTVTLAKRYWWVRWAGLSVGAWPMLKVGVTNRNMQAVHSFSLRFVERRTGHSSGIGTQPERGLSPGSTWPNMVQEPEEGFVSVCVDFVQFVSGDMWCSSDDGSLVSEAGVHAGASAAAAHFLGVLARSDAATVMSLLARVHADVQGPVTDPRFGSFGFYCGVTNMAVRLQVTYDRDGLNGVENLLRFGRPTG